MTAIRLVRTLLLPMLLAGAPATAVAQQSLPDVSVIRSLAEPGSWHTPPADSARLLAYARSAQSRFEFVRRNHLPWTWSRGGGPCDERIGRFCLWYSNGESSWQPPPDPEPVVRARTSLIARLDTAAAVIPGDWWVAGQRIRYLVEGGHFEEAREAARACRSPEGGWCAALLGYALHSGGDYVEADSMFTVALAQMAPRERERWTDLSPLLEVDALRTYRRLEAEERSNFEVRYWWLAKPLFMVPGNDRRTEHFARHVVDRLQDRARQTEGISWGSDLRELLLRYGAPAGWERIRPTGYSMESGSMVTRYASGGRHFDPPLRFHREPLEIRVGEWDIDPQRSRTGYAPAYGAPVEAPEHQIAVFQRGDSARVLAAMRLTPDSVGVRPAIAGALVLASDETEPPLVALGEEPGDSTVALMLTAPAAPRLLSAEVLAREAKRAARVRHAVALGPLPPHGLAVSDLLLLRDAEILPDSLDAAVPLVRPSTTARAGERIGIFWEIYGLGTADLPLDVAVHLIDGNAGVLRRLAQRARLLQPITPLSVRWEEVPDQPSGILARSLAVQLPELNPGSYILRVTLTARGREAVQTQRTVTVVE
jgi:hypothetical protein